MLFRIHQPSIYRPTILLVFFLIFLVVDRFSRSVSIKNCKIDVKQMVSSFMMNSSICSHFSPLRNSPSRESADEHFLSLLGSMITLYLTFKYVSLSKNPSNWLEMKSFKNINQESYKETQS